MMEQKKLKGKVKFLGWGSHIEASGVVVSNTRCLIDGCRLIVQTNAGVWLAGEPYNLIKPIIDNFGVGLRYVDAYAINDNDIEIVFEPIPDAKPRLIYVNKGTQMPPTNVYVLVTEFFSREFWISLYREDSDGNRTFLWEDDYESSSHKE